MQRKTLIAILCGLLAVLLCLGTVLVVYTFTQKEDSSEIYQQKLDTGKKYLEGGDYEQAIAAYRAAIDADPTNDEAYYQLAMLYRDLNRMQEMKAVLEEGISKTSSDRLKQLYEFYFGELTGNDSQSTDSGNLDNAGDKEPGNNGINISYNNSRAIANYAFKDYVVNYRNPILQKVDNQYRYTFDGLEGTVYFFNSDQGESIDFAGDIPFDEVRPNYVIMNDLSVMFDGVADGQRIKSTELMPLGANVTKSQAYDNVLGDYIQFEFNNCVFEVAVDGDNSFGMDAAHRLYSKFGTGAGEVAKKFTNEIIVIDATTGSGVANADVVIRKGTFNTGAAEFTGRTDSQGKISFELFADVYTIEVSCDGYITEVFEFEVYSTGVCSVESVTISPELGDADLRIVLEWGDYPRDLDSYLIDDTGRVKVNYQNSLWMENGDKVAELDVDDTTGYGPETITVYDLSKDFTYFVHDYTTTGDMFSRSDITVKVYTSGGTETYTIPMSDSSANGWCVFSYIDGNIVTRNSEVPGLSDFRHYN